MHDNSVDGVICLQGARLCHSVMAIHNRNKNKGKRLYQPVQIEWPRGLVVEELEIICLDYKSEHVHLANCFPLFMLSVYFQKVLLFSNQLSSWASPVKR